MTLSNDAPARLEDATGVLVAGGGAVRMGGVPKGTLLLEGESIAHRTLRLFRALFAEALVVANDPTPWSGLGVRVVPDVVTGKGAPGGLHAALVHARTPWIFTAGCDMPFLEPRAIGWLAAQREGAAAVIPTWRGRLEPLHAFWSRGCLDALARLLREGDPSLRAIAAAVGARVVGEEEWRVLDPEGRAFENVNTPDDAARLGLTVPRSVGTARR